MNWRLLALIGLVGFGLGGAIGRAKFSRLDDHRPLCISCHHSTIGLGSLSVGDAPHSVDFDAPCHACHVLPVREYLTYSFASWGMSAPEWVSEIDNPTIDGQTCKECHLVRGRGVLPCEKCHAELDSAVHLAEACDVCHAEGPLHPHNNQDCRDCHVEVFLDPHNTSEQMMADKIAGDLPPPADPTHSKPSPHREADAGGHH